MLALPLLTACEDDVFNGYTDKEETTDSDDTGTTTTVDNSGFALGADVSWLTEMEASGYSFYDADGTETDCLELLQSLGTNAIRLRVWVDPEDGWCNKADVLYKAYRANRLGMRIMIDFHYSDSWADPATQDKPAAWEDLSFDELKDAVSEHTTEVLQLLKDNDIYPEWIQIGNETSLGMLWTDGYVYNSASQYVELHNAGYAAAKAVFPDAITIVHVHNGYASTYPYLILNYFNDYGGNVDALGVSLYPSSTDYSNWADCVDDCISVLNNVVSTYGKQVLVAEFGYDVDDAEAGYHCLSYLIEQCQTIDDCLGVFYWEPECYGDWEGYSMGAFEDDGTPSVILDAFLNPNSEYVESSAATTYDNLYLLGINDDWNFSYLLYPTDDNDQLFEGVAGVSSCPWGYRFGTEVDDWDNVYQSTTGEDDGTIALAGGSDIPFTDTGVFLWSVDLENLTYEYTEVTTVYYTGFNDDWSLVAMTQDSDSPWIFSSDITISAASEWGGQFQLDDSWTYYVGGDSGTMEWKTNCTLDASLSAGTYTVTLDFVEQTIDFSAQ